MKNITIGRRSFFLGAVAAAVSSALPATAAHASGGSSGPHVSFATQGHIGEVIVNPYSIAPLTAIIRNGGYELTEATVRIVPKPQGQEIKYKVSRSELLTHAGIPVFGLYPDYMKYRGNDLHPEVPWSDRKVHGHLQDLRCARLPRSERFTGSSSQYV